MNKKILIVEDSHLMIAVLRRFISSDYPDITIVEAHSGEEAIEMYKKEHPNLVFMDILMPGMDGITALENIRKTDGHAKIVMCTSLKESMQEERAKAAGCSDYIMKPFTKQQIVDAVKKFT